MPIRPLVLTEPIGSVKVLQNNTVQVNLIHMNNTEDPIHLLLSSDNGETFKDIELKYSNLILNLEGGKDYILKTKETGTKFNFTITATDAGANEVADEDANVATKVGCYHDGTFYAVGEEFRIGCTELCECTGQDQKECAALLCPAHVGLELVSKGCVRWAPPAPAQPPNCCPRTARCLSNGTCHYKGVPVPNWSEVPIELTGCEQRCFCENGELECQETCTPLPPVPPQTMRCPPMHRPAPVNISDDDCCKQWGCIPHAGSNKTTHKTFTMPILDIMNYITPIAPILPTISTSVLPTPPMTTNPSEFYRHLNTIKVVPKFVKTPTPTLNDIPKYSINSLYKHNHGDNITVFALEDANVPVKNIYPDSSFTDTNWNLPSLKSHDSIHVEPIKIPVHVDKIIQSHSHRHNSFVPSDSKMHDMIQQTAVHPSHEIQSSDIPKAVYKNDHEKIIKVPISEMEHFNYFVPIMERKPEILSYINDEFRPTPRIASLKSTQSLFKPIVENETTPSSSKSMQRPHTYDSIAREPIQVSRSKHVTILRNKDLKSLKAAENNQLWTETTKTHLLTKAPNPYETVLLRAVPNAKIDILSNYDRESKSPRIAEKTYSTLDLEHLLSQMEVESEVNRNLGRSADKSRDVAGQSPESALTTNPPHMPSFLPTIPPEIHFPQEDLSDYDQNNIHRPVNTLPGLPPGLSPGIHGPSSFGDNNKKLSVISLQADSPTSVMMLFGLPPVLVGLRGRVDLRYTDKADEDVSHWFSQVFAPADEVLSTPRLEFRLTGLKPSTMYKVRGKLYLHNLPVEPESEIYTVRTQDLPTVTPVEEKRREIDSKLTVVDFNDTSAHVSWRHFSEEELQFIDGIQVRLFNIKIPLSYNHTTYWRASKYLKQDILHFKWVRELIRSPFPRSLMIVVAKVNAVSVSTTF
ncbi:unnamed protein product [Diatraea saccharalis]|uniref:VWFC domain-containing protein n=1 Tax=Diatraea saccharalis TaxID=40085 RepID=A0A9P0C959_9NEOP|nr:unnamed protein product [Diatraea saccharalis]